MMLKTQLLKMFANNVKQFTFIKIYSNTACAIANPSSVDVPFPSSSNITKEFLK